MFTTGNKNVVTPFSELQFKKKQNNLLKKTGEPMLDIYSRSLLSTEFMFKDHQRIPENFDCTDAYVVFRMHT